MYNSFIGRPQIGWQTPNRIDSCRNTNSDYTEALRGVLNTGFERGGVYTMSVSQGKDSDPRDFSTFCPKMIAGIGKVLPTIHPVRVQTQTPE